MTGSPRMDSPLWTFSLAVYRGTGVQAECLDVQERLGVDVNLLLFCAYAGAVDGAALTDVDIAQVCDAIGAWHAEVVRTLRQARRTLKPWGAAGQGDFSQVAEALRVRVKGAELDAERIEQAMLWAWAQPRTGGWCRVDRRDALVANLRALLVRCGAHGSDADPMQALPNLLDAAMLAGSRQPASTRAPEAASR